MKKPLLTIATIAAVITLLNADTITWTGNGDGNFWNDLANWVAASTSESPDHVPLYADTPVDQIVIDNGNDVHFNMKESGSDAYRGARLNVDGKSITVTGGAKLTIDSDAGWYGENGVINVEGGILDLGPLNIFHGGTPTFNVSNGGVLVAGAAIDSNVNLDATSTYEKASANSHAHTGEEKFSKFTATAQNVELSATSETAKFSDDIIWTCKLISAAGVSIVWEAGSLVLWDTAYGGYYNAGGTIDIAEGWTGSFTFAYTPANVFASCFQGKIKYNGAELTAETFNDLFDVVATTIVDANGTEHAASRVSLAVASDWKLGVISATDISGSGATVSTTVSEIGSGAFAVYVACDVDAITEANILSLGEAVGESAGAYSKTYTDLVDNTVYNYAFAIITNGAVAAFKSSSFFASDFDYVYCDGRWLGSVPSTLNTAKSVLIMSPYDNKEADIAVANTVISNASLRTGTLVGSGPMQVYSSSIVNGKLGDTGAVCGTYNGVTFMNFVSLSGNGVVYRACSYTFNATEEWKNNAYDLLFNTQERIHLNGAKVDADIYASNFTLTDNGETGNEKTPYNLTLTYWEPVWTGVPKADWTVQPGARVMLTKDTRIGALTVADSTDVKIDLNGHNLKVVALFVNGEKKKGEFTKGTLSILTGEGSLTVGGPGFSVVVR